ncbi:MAG: AAA family ATPase [Candidatus Parabeggiatoa sp.]|nr:AAA family ATPase [Candidatus Parabeggiatoa sp.]
MFELPGYTVTEQIYQGLETIVYRGYRTADHLPVIIKALNDYPEPKKVAQLHHEYDITKDLNLKGIIKSIGLQKHHNRWVLIFEDIGGHSFKHILATQEIDLATFLHIAIQLADSLGELHTHNIIHKDIKPANIIVNFETGQVKITDFSISSRLAQETQNQTSPNLLEGTLLYMSPEQTGRMNLPLDYRADFYSLGVVFYETLVGQPPFIHSDAMELVHCHIATMPTPPRLINPNIPKVISHIVMKLLAKQADARYQSAFGLKADLQACQQQLQVTGTIQAFRCGQQDISDKFQMPAKLYGREREIETLLNAFRRVTLEKGLNENRGAEIMLVSGYSGIGKSRLVKEIYKPITQQRGYLITGKFEQFQRNLPYSALVSAFSDLMRQLLTESDEQLRLWCDKLERALHPNAQVIINLIPEVQLIMGEQSTVPLLGALEAENRFNLVFQNFIQVFCQKEHPLVIFLDDLHWIDSASLKLLERLMTDAKTHYLFLIGAYRSNEVSLAHPLMLTLERMRKANTVINDIFLQPIDFDNINDFIADALKSSQTFAQPLTEVIFQKTQGNPFFATQFLKSLFQDGLLTYHFAQRHWQYDLAQIKTLPASDNVVEFLVAKLQKLSKKTIEVLKLAACIGYQFDLATLSTVYEHTSSQTAAALFEALQEELILPLSENYKFYEFESVDFQGMHDSENDQNPTDESLLTADRCDYQFLHDRVQQAAYSLIPDEAVQKIHLKIGRLLLNTLPPEALSSEKAAMGTSANEKWKTKMFNLVNHLNLGADLITTAAEQDEIIHLNLIAARKAKAAMAYELAVKYLNQGLKRLGQSSWQNQYQLTLSLHIEAIEAEYLNTHFERSKQLSQIVLKHAQNVLEKVKVYELQIPFYIAQNQMLAAMEAALKALNLLDIFLPEKVSTPKIVVGLLATKLALRGKPIEVLIELPEMTEPNKLAAMRILMSAVPAVFVVKQALFPIIVFTMMKLSLKYGNSPAAAFAYAAYGVILAGRVGEVEAGYQFGQLGDRLLEKTKAKELKPRLAVGMEFFTRHWQEHVRKTLGPWQTALQNALESGNLEFVGHCAAFYSNYLFLSGEPLDLVDEKMAQALEMLIKYKQEFQTYYTQIWRQITHHLQGLATTDKGVLQGDCFNEVDILPVLMAAKNQMVIFAVYFAKLYLNYLFKDDIQAIANARLASEYEEGVIGSMNMVQLNFYYSLALLAWYPKASQQEQKQAMKQVKQHQKKLKKWARYAPMNYQHKYVLVEAEKARVLGEVAKAMSGYKDAIMGARKQEYIQEEALAYELGAEFYDSVAQNEFAQLYRQKAYSCYKMWGAKAKIEVFEKQHPQLFKQQKTISLATQSIQSAITHTVSMTIKISQLDFSSVMKASQAIVSEIHLDKLLIKLMRIMIENAGAQRAFLLLNDDGELKLQAASEPDSKEIIVMQSLPLFAISHQLSTALVNYVARTYEHLLLNDAYHEGRFSNDSYIVNNQPQSILCTAILRQGKLIGLLYLENNLICGAFTPEHLEVLKILLAPAAISIENAFLYQTLEHKVAQRTVQLAQANEEITILNEQLQAENLRMSAELDVARHLQQMVLPKAEELNEIEGLDIACFMEPADEVGGDYYDILKHDGRIKIAIGDVTGHGLESGVLMLMVQMAVRTLLVTDVKRPDTFLTLLNRAIYDNVKRIQTDKNMTLSLLDYHKGSLQLTGQHEEVLLARQGGIIEPIDTIDLGFSVGVVADISNFVSLKEIQLAPGDGIVLYTDGITEARDLEMALYGFPRLCDIVHQNWHRSAKEIQSAIIADVRQHIGTQKVFDDITLLVLKQK